MPEPHDNAYKNLFSHPQAVSDLLRGFVDEDWVAWLDFDTLEKVSGSYVSDDLRDREDDIIWRIRMRADESAAAGYASQGEWLYVYLLLEFQSNNDPYMAVRILTYIGLLYQDLIKSGQVRSTSANPASAAVRSARLPAVFPLVLYNGERPWSAARDIEQLIENSPPSLMAYRPRLRYFVLDEGRVPEHKLQGQADNAIASVLRLERSANAQDITEAVGQLVQTLKAPHNRELRRALTVWINRVVLRRFAPDGDSTQPQDLTEVQQMISERIDNWKEQLLQQGVQRGKLEGKLEGQAQLLRRILVRRFGALPTAVEAQISAASLEQLESWFDRSIEAPGLDAVFARH